MFMALLEGAADRRSGRSTRWAGKVARGPDHSPEVCSFPAVKPGAKAGVSDP